MSHYVTAGGQRIRVEVRPGIGVPLVLGNGIGASLESLDPLVELLGCPVVRFDVPVTGVVDVLGPPGAVPWRSSSPSRIRAGAGDWCWWRPGRAR